MQRVYLSDSGPKVSQAIYGFYRWKDAPENSKTMERIINLTLELGINTFDHADIYGGGTIEELFGNTLRQKNIKREDVVLFTKCGVVEPHPSQSSVRVRYIDSSKKHIVTSLENSLRKLRTDYVDVFLLHHLDPVADLEETATTLDKLRESGKIKNIGIVNFSVFQHQLLSSWLRFPIVSNHIELNLLNTAALENGQIDYSKQKYMRPLVTSPLAEGRIANSTEKIPLRLRGKLEEMAAKYNTHFESVAIAWLVKLGALPLIGTTDEQRIRHIAAAFSVDLDRQDWHELYAVSRGQF